MQTIGDRIRSIMADNQMKQGAFADSLKVNQSSVSLWLSGKANPSAQTIQQICDKFGYNPDWLATGEGEPRSLAAEDQQIIDYLTHAMKYKTTSADRLIRAVAVVARTNPEILDSAIAFMQRLLEELDPPE